MPTALAKERYLTSASSYQTRQVWTTRPRVRARAGGVAFALLSFSCAERRLAQLDSKGGGNNTFGIDACFSSRMHERRAGGSGLGSGETKGGRGTVIRSPAARPWRSEQSVTLAIRFQHSILSECLPWIYSAEILLGANGTLISFDTCHHLEIRWAATQCVDVGDRRVI